MLEREPMFVGPAEKREPREEKEPPQSYEILDSEESRDRIQRRMEGLTHEMHDKAVDAVVFLDRSARPLAWMMRAQWKKDYPDENLPEMKFVNIGRSTGARIGNENKFHDSIRSAVNDRDAVLDLKYMFKDHKWLDREDVKQFIPDPVDGDIYHEGVKKAEHLKTIFGDRFKDKSVLIIDELSCTGTTQIEALQLFSLAFSDAREIHSTNFEHMPRTTEKTTQEFIPWYGKSGIAGVLELPDKDLLSSALTQDNIDQQRELLRLQVEALKSEQIHRLESTFEGIDAKYQKYFPHLDANQRMLFGKLAGKKTHLVKKIQKFDDLGEFHAFRSAYMNAFEAPGTWADEMDRYMVPEFPDTFALGKILQLERALASKDNIDEMRKKAKQLRAELISLVNEGD